MYIGPWQEFKLAKILQLKDKVDQEEREANKLEAHSAAATSHNGKFIAQPGSNQANSQGFQNQRNNIQYRNSEKYSEHAMSEPRQRRASRGSKGKPLAKRQMRNKSHNLPKPQANPNRHFSNAQMNKYGPNNYIPAKRNQQSNGSPTSNNTNYSSKVIKSTSNSFKNIENASINSKSNLGSNRTLGAGKNDRLSYLNSTNTSEARSYGTHLVHEMRKKNFMNNFGGQNMNRHIEATYDKWNRFENFVKFATNKEKRDRLNEVLPPPVEHYVDGDTLYKIKEMGRGRPPRIIKKPLVTKTEVKKQHKDRVNQMRMLYGIGVSDAPTQNIINDDVEMPQKNQDTQQKVFEYNPEGSDKFDNSSNSMKEESKTKTAKLEPLRSNATQQNETKPKNNSASLYSFYQNIIDKNNEDHTSDKIKEKMSHPNYKVHVPAHSSNDKPHQSEKGPSCKESPSLAQKSSKFKNAARDIGKRFQ